MKNSLLLALSLSVVCASSLNLSAKEKARPTSSMRAAAHGTASQLKSALKVALPYVLVLTYFQRVEPEVTRKVDGNGMQAGVKKLLEAFVGVWFLDKVKDHAKYLDAVLGNPFDFDCDEAAA